MGKRNGYAFASGKFDEKLLRPLSAFSDAKTSLAKYIAVESNEKGGLSTATLIRDKIREEFDEEDVEQLGVCCQDVRNYWDWEYKDHP